MARKTFFPAGNFGLTQVSGRSRLIAIARDRQNPTRGFLQLVFFPGIAREIFADSQNCILDFGLHCIRQFNQRQADVRAHEAEYVKSIFERCGAFPCEHGGKRRKATLQKPRGLPSFLPAAGKDNLAQIGRDI